MSDDNDDVTHGFDSVMQSPGVSTVVHAQPIQVADIFVGRPNASSVIFKDKTVFDLDHIPNSLLHRDEQIARLKLILSDMDNGVKPKNTLVVGTFGTGKTVVTRGTCQELPFKPVVIYVNCAEINTRLQVIREALSQLKDREEKSGFPPDFYLRWFKEEAEHHKFVILILDEIDKLVEHRDSEYGGLFYTLSRTVKNVIVIMITNRANFETLFLAGLDPRTKDTFYFTRIEFPDYYASELRDILRDRALIGLNLGTYDEGTIATIAKISYDNVFRARGVIKITRLAGEIAEAKGHKGIELADIQDATSHLAEVQEMDLVKRLPPIQQGLLRYVLANAPTNEACYDYFVLLGKKLGIGISRPRYQGFISDLDTLGLMDRVKHGRGRGRGVETKLIIKPEVADIVARSLESDIQFSGLTPPAPPQSDVKDKDQQ